MYEWINKDDRDIGGFQELKLQPSLNMPIRPGIIRSGMRVSLLTKTLTGILIESYSFKTSHQQYQQGQWN